MRAFLHDNTAYENMSFDIISSFVFLWALLISIFVYDTAFFVVHGDN